MLRGVCTITFFAGDVAAAQEWYTELLGVEAYFNRPGPDGRTAYVEFRIGDYQTELGILDSAYAPHTGSGGVVTYWAVDDVRAAFDRLLALGAKEHEPVTERGPGYVTASVLDPFGNVFGVMYNEHYLETLGS